MRYCKKCVQPDTRPNIVFDENGVCGACNYWESRKSIDWDARKKELQNIVDWAKAHGSSYDCVIGVSGGKDSHFQALYAKYELGLNPLLVCNAPDGRTKVGTHNIENLRSYGFDLIEIRPDPKVMMNLTKRDFFKYGNLVRSSEYSLWASAYRVACEKAIPLIIQGENPAAIFGLSDNVYSGDALTIVNNNTIKGCNAKDLIITDEEAELYGCEPITYKQLHMFDFPMLRVYSSGKKAIFLQHYVKEWGQVHNTLYSRVYGLKGRYDEYVGQIGRSARETSVDGDHLLVNQWLKYMKFGFGYETDWQCYLIREIGASREEAIKAVKLLDHRLDIRYVENFCDYIGISLFDFNAHVESQLINNRLFSVSLKYDLGKMHCNIKPKFEVGVGLCTDNS
jgi:N-acetyl sugar amidotransferase